MSLAGPGFINFKLHESGAAGALRALLGRGPEVVRAERRRGESIQLEFVSANPTGPLNVVSARAAAYGSTLARLLQAAGHDMDCEFYVNDAGRQVDLLGASVRARFVERLGGSEPFPEDGYHGEYVFELANRVPEGDGRAWLALAGEASARSFGAFAVEQSPTGQGPEREHVHRKYAVGERPSP